MVISLSAAHPQRAEAVKKKGAKSGGTNFQNCSKKGLTRVAKRGIIHEPPKSGSEKRGGRGAEAIAG